MNQQGLLLSVDDVFLHFGDVVADVVNQVHVQVVGSLIEDFGKRLTSWIRLEIALNWIGDWIAMENGLDWRLQMCSK